MAPSHSFQLRDSPSGPAGLAARERQSKSLACLETPPQPSSEQGKEPKILPLRERQVPETPQGLVMCSKGPGGWPQRRWAKILGQGGCEVMPPGDVGGTHSVVLRRWHSNCRKGYRSP